MSIAFGSTNPHVDLFVRLCAVDARGHSVNVTDAIIGFGRGEHAAAAPLESPQPVTITLAPTAAHFAAGHRIRLQVSSGAHPLHLRNGGADDPLGTHNGELQASRQSVALGGGHDRLTLPIFTAASEPRRPVVS